MKKNTFSSTCGILLVLLGIFVMTGWYVQLPVFLSIVPTYVSMVFNSALCFALAGVALVLSSYTSRFQPYGVLLGWVILLFTAIIFSQYLFHYSLGIDHLFVNVWRTDQNPFPGRAAKNTLLAFMMAGLTFVLWPYSRHKSTAVVTHILILGILMLGFSAFMGYMLNLEFLYEWYPYARMAIHTAIGFGILGVGLWSVWSRTEGYLSLYNNREDRKILLLCGIILFAITCIAGLTGFAVAAHSRELLQQDDFWQILRYQLALTIPILLLTLIVGFFLFYWQILPLVRKLIRAEQEAQTSNALLKAAEEMLKHMAYHDVLTGLANRSQLEMVFNQALAIARRQQKKIGVLFLDLDYFKQINDTLGHDMGDALLQEVAQRLKNCIREMDIAARLGGDEFVIIITEVAKIEDITVVLQRIFHALSQTFVIKDESLSVTTSMGISCYPQDGEDLRTLLKNADLALYKAKTQGRNTYQFYSLMSEEYSSQ